MKWFPLMEWLTGAAGAGRSLCYVIVLLCDPGRLLDCRTGPTLSGPPASAAHATHRRLPRPRLKTLTSHSIAVGSHSFMLITNCSKSRARKALCGIVMHRQRCHMLKGLSNPEKLFQFRCLSFPVTMGLIVTENDRHGASIVRLYEMK